MATGLALGTGLQALVLAAGSATRFGGRKLLADWKGAPLLHAALSAAQAAPVGAVTVVTGADAADIEACATAFDPQIRHIHAPDHHKGMAASLRAGVAALPRETQAVFVFLGDMPRVPRAVLKPMADAVRAGAPAAAPVFQGRRGNPVILAREVFTTVATLTGDTGARDLLLGLGARLVLVESPDDGVLFDVDVPGDMPGWGVRP